MKTLNENYTSVCHYCGVIFKNNRHKGKFCSDNHRSNYGLHGARIISMVKDREGVLINADRYLRVVYNDLFIKNRDGWSSGYPEQMLPSMFEYTGPLPKGTELLVVGSYVIKRSKQIRGFSDRILVKPFTLLNTEERATQVIVGVEQNSKG